MSPAKLTAQVNVVFNKSGFPRFWRWAPCECKSNTVPGEPLNGA